VDDEAALAVHRTVRRRRVASRARRRIALRRVRRARRRIHFSAAQDRRVVAGRLGLGLSAAIHPIHHCVAPPLAALGLMNVCTRLPSPARMRLTLFLLSISARAPRYSLSPSMMTTPPV